MESRLQLDSQSLGALAGRMGARETRVEDGRMTFSVGGKKLEVSAINVAARVVVNGVPVDVLSVTVRADGVEVRFSVAGKEG